VPELPEVETVRSALEPVLQGQQISTVRLTRQDLRWPLPRNLPESLTGQKCGLPWRRGKYILIPLLPSGKTLLIHLGMSGAIRLYQHQPAQFGKHDHFSVGLADGQWFVFSDPRRFGHLDLLESGKEEAHPLLSGMGVEPLSNHFSSAYLDRVLAARKQPIKTALLDQRLIAGLGNIYVSEALFRARISPRRQARNIVGKRTERLVPAIRATLTEAISAGGTSLRDHIQPGGEIGYFVQNLKVYGREGAGCSVCDKPIKMLRQGGRSGFYCPNCQR
jgi:formamidopyrimidine-DNA glycosylase